MSNPSWVTFNTRYIVHCWDVPNFSTDINGCLFSSQLLNCQWQINFSEKKLLKSCSWIKKKALFVNKGGKLLHFFCLFVFSMYAKVRRILVPLKHDDCLKRRKMKREIKSSKWRIERRLPNFHLQTKKDKVATLPVWRAPVSHQGLWRFDKQVLYPQSNCYTINGELVAKFWFLFSDMS